MAKLKTYFELVKQNGALRVVDTRRYRQYVDTLVEGQVQEMTLGDPEASRTDRQNRYLWAEPIRKFCAHTGYTPAEMKLVLLGSFFGWKTLPTGEHIPTKPSTSDLSKREMTEWIDWLIQFGAEQGINILPPEPDQAKRDPRVETDTYCEGYGYGV